MRRLVYVCADRGVPVFGSKGSSVHVQEMIRALRRAGVAVELIAASTGGDAPSDLAAVPVRRLPPAPAGDAGERERHAVAANHVLGSLLAAGETDVIYERHALWSFAAMEHARERGLPSLLEVNAPLLDEQERHRTLADRSLAAHATRRAFEAAGAIVAVSREVADYVASFGVPEPRIHVIPNAVDPGRFAPPTPPARPAPSGAFTVGFLGSLRPWHGLPVLAEAFTLLLRERPSARLLVVGDGPARGDLDRALTAAGAAPAVTWTGAVAAAAVPGLLASMDAAVAPYPATSGFYFSPLKVFEYMAAGLAVVASDIGQIREVIRHEVTGLLCPPGDAAALARALARLAADPALRARLGAAARAQVAAHHSWGATAERMLALARAQRSPAPTTVEAR